MLILDSSAFHSLSANNETIDDQISLKISLPVYSADFNRYPVRSAAIVLGLPPHIALHFGLVCVTCEAVTNSQWRQSKESRQIEGIHLHRPALQVIS